MLRYYNHPHHWQAKISRVEGKENKQRKANKVPIYKVQGRPVTVLYKHSNIKKKQ